MDFSLNKYNYYFIIINYGYTSMACEKKKNTIKVGLSNPTYLMGLGERINSVARYYGSREAAAKAANITVNQLINYIKGRTNPSFVALKNLLTNTPYSMEWLASGEQPNPQLNIEGMPLDEKILETVVEGLDSYLLDRGLLMPPKKKGQAINALYQKALKEEIEYQQKLNERDIDEFLKAANNN